MARSQELSEIYSAAWEFARGLQTKSGALRKLQRAYPDLDISSSKEIMDNVWPRAERVKYMEDSNQGLYFSSDKLGCGETGNVLVYTFSVQFTDEDGNQMQRYMHAKIHPIRSRIGQNNAAAGKDILRQLQNGNYFEGWDIADIRQQIQAAPLLNVRCLQGG